MAAEILIHSRRMNKTYRIYRFSEYSIDMDMETDADQFQIKFGNPSTPPGETPISASLSGVFNKFDPIDIKINGKSVLHGILDSIKYADNYCVIIGRDVMAAYIDNDSTPQTLKNVKPKDYITKRIHAFNPNLKLVFPSSISTMKELKINVGETELATMQRLLVQDDYKIWVIYDTVYVGKYNYDLKPSHYFSRGLPSEKSGIPFDNLTITDDGTNLSSEFSIYGTQSSGKEKIYGTAKNSWLINQGVKKRRVIAQDETTYASKYNAHALWSVKEQFRNGIVITFDIKTTNALVLPNTTCVLTDWRHRLDGVFFVRGVNYAKTINGGAVTHVTAVPANHTFDMVWLLDPASGKNVTSGSANSPYVLGLPGMTMDQLLSKRKR